MLSCCTHFSTTCSPTCSTSLKLLPLPPLFAPPFPLQEGHELLSAKEMFGGRLNAEFILERTGHARFSELRQADYPGCALRTVQLQPEEALSSLMRWVGLWLPSNRTQYSEG